MESFNNAIMVVSVALLVWYVGKSLGRTHVRQEVQGDRPEQKVDERPTEGGGDFMVLLFLIAAAGGVADLVLGK